VQALHHHAAVMREAGQNGQGHVLVEAVGGIDVGHVRVALREDGHEQVAVDVEQAAHGLQGLRRCGGGMLA